jgi:hypothetical protein
MLDKCGSRSALCSLLLVAVMPSLLLNVGPNRGLLIHDHDHGGAHLHVLHGAAGAEYHHHQQLSDGKVAGDHHTDIVIVGSELARPRPATSDAPALLHALPAPPLILTALPMIPAIAHRTEGMAAGAPKTSLALQTCVQMLI